MPAFIETESAIVASYASIPKGSIPQSAWRKNNFIKALERGIKQTWPSLAIKCIAPESYEILKGLDGAFMENAIASIPAITDEIDRNGVSEYQFLTFLSELNNSIIADDDWAILTAWKRYDVSNWLYHHRAFRWTYYTLESLAPTSMKPLDGKAITLDLYKSVKDSVVAEIVKKRYTAEEKEAIFESIDPKTLYPDRNRLPRFVKSSSVESAIVNYNKGIASALKLLGLTFTDLNLDRPN